MRVIIYWSNILVAISVFVVSWLVTSASMLESLGISLVAFISANILEHTRQLLGIKARGHEIHLVRNPLLNENEDSDKDKEKDD